MAQAAEGRWAALSPLELSQKESIIRRLSFIEVELADLQDFAGLTYQVYVNDRHKRREIERLVENLANAASDIAKIILAGEGMEVPATYQQVFAQLARANIIPASMARELGELARLRNVLAHQYLDLKWDKLKKFIDRGPQLFRKFTAAVEKVMEETPSVDE